MFQTCGLLQTLKFAKIPNSACEYNEDSNGYLNFFMISIKVYLQHFKLKLLRNI